MKKILLTLLITTLLISCGRNLTPYQASQKGGMKCGKNRLR
jgi:hypothetical protein